jgi:hypothetical protein
MSSIRSHQYVTAALVIAAHCWAAFLVADDKLALETPKPVPEERIVTIRLGVATSLGEPSDSKSPDPTLTANVDEHAIEPQIADKENAGQTPPTSRTAPYYYRTSELDKVPAVQQDVLDSLPVALPGEKPVKTVLRLLINDQGDIDEILVENSQLPLQATKLLVEKFSRMKFEPGKIAGAPVRSQLTIEVEASASQ